MNIDSITGNVAEYCLEREGAVLAAAVSIILPITHVNPLPF